MIPILLAVTELAPLVETEWISPGLMQPKHSAIVETAISDPGPVISFGLRGRWAERSPSMKGSCKTTVSRESVHSYEHCRGKRTLLITTGGPAVFHFSPISRSFLYARSFEDAALNARTGLYAAISDARQREWHRRLSLPVDWVSALAALARSVCGLCGSWAGRVFTRSTRSLRTY